MVDASIISSAIELMTPIMESSIILAGHYTKGCGRNTVTSEDVKYAMRFCTRNLVGKHVGTLFPELQDEEDSEDEDVEEVDEDEEPFTRYQGEDPQLVAINQCYDTWGEWEPTNMVEKWLKNAIDKQ